MDDLSEQEDGEPEPEPEALGGRIEAPPPFDGS